MSPRSNYVADARKRRRRVTLLWVAVSVVVVIGLLYYEQVALLYILATVGMALLLTVVAFADLGETRRATSEPAPFDDAAAIADGLTPATVATPPRAATAARPPRRKRGR